MLSRRRSSEQTTAPPHNLAASPSSQRLEASLRGVTVLFSVVATPDVDDTAAVAAGAPPASPYQHRHHPLHHHAQHPLKAKAKAAAAASDEGATTATTTTSTTTSIPTTATVARSPGLDPPLMISLSATTTTITSTSSPSPVTQSPSSGTAPPAATAAPGPTPPVPLQSANVSSPSATPSPMPAPTPTPTPTGARRRLFAGRHADDGGGGGGGASNTNSNAAATGSGNVQQRLVITASVKNVTLLRMHQVSENMATGRVSVNKVWNISELRRIDALGLPLEESLKFGMYFSSNKMLVWRTLTPVARAKFMWSVLQLCASRLKRAPPLLRLKLLDLQTFAEDPPPSLPSTGRLLPLPPQQQHQQQISPSSSKSKGKHQKTSGKNHAHASRANHSHPHRARSDPNTEAAQAAVRIVDGHPQLPDDELNFRHEPERSPSSSTTSGFARSERWQGRQSEDALKGSPHHLMRNAQGKRPGVAGDCKARGLNYGHHPHQTGSTTTVTETSATLTTSGTGLQRVNSPQRESNALKNAHGTIEQRVMRTLSEPKVSASIVRTPVDASAQPHTTLRSEQGGQSQGQRRDAKHERRYGDANLDDTGIVNRVKNVNEDNSAQRFDDNSNDFNESNKGGESDDESLSDNGSDEVWVSRPKRKGKGGRGKQKYGKSGNRTNKSKNRVKDREMNIDERAFLAAAKRMGAKELSPMCKAEVIQQFASVGSDPKSQSGGRGVSGADDKQNGQKCDSDGDEADDQRDGEADDIVDDGEQFFNGVMKGRKYHGERKALSTMKLSKECRDDLTYALQLFLHDTSSKSSTTTTATSNTSTNVGALSEFGAWTERQIQSLEVDNVSDIVRAEQEQARHRKTRSRADDVHRRDATLTSDREHDFEDPHALLMREMADVELWLAKNQTLLAPYARLARDIHGDVELLELQRRNVVAINDQLNRLLMAIHFTPAEKELLNDLDRDILDLSPDPAEANYTEVFQAVEMMARRMDRLSVPPVSRMSNISAVQEARRQITQRQMKTSRALLPCLRRFLDIQYHVQSGGSVTTPGTGGTGTATATATSMTASTSPATAVSSPLPTTPSALTMMSETTTGAGSATTSNTGTSLLHSHAPSDNMTPQRNGARRREWEVVVSSVDDIRLNMAEEIASPVFSEFFKGARCLHMCSQSSFTHLIDHFVSVSSSWVRAVVRHTMSTTDQSPRSPLPPTRHQPDLEEPDDHMLNLMDAMFYACLSEGYSAYRLFSPILKEVSARVSSSPSLLSSGNDNNIPETTTPSTINYSKPPLPRKQGDAHHSQPNSASQMSYANDLYHTASEYLDDILRRQVPDVSFIQQWLSHFVPNDDINVQACALLHAAYVIDAYVFSLEHEPPSGGNAGGASNVRVSVRDVVTRVERKLGLEPLAPPVDGGNGGTSLFSYRRTLFDQTFNQTQTQSQAQAQQNRADRTNVPVVLNGYDITKSKTLDDEQHPSFGRYDSLSPQGQVVRLLLPQFVTQCRSIVSQCVATVDSHVTQCVSDLATDHDIVDADGRALFFARVTECVDLCHGLASARVYSLPSSAIAPSSSQPGSDTSVLDSRSKTKSLCEKLIAAVMHHTEVVAANGPKSCGDMVKLQAYAYVAARLSDSSRNLSPSTSTTPSVSSKTIAVNIPSTTATGTSISSTNSSATVGNASRDHLFIMQLANLSDRVRSHVMKQWIEHHIFDSVLEGLNISPLKQPAIHSQSQTIIKFRQCISSLNAVEVATKMKSQVDTCMENAARTCAIIPIYSELITHTRERMELVLRHARRDKSISDLRPRLLSFSRELLSILRSELRRAHQKLKHLL